VERLEEATVPPVPLAVALVLAGAEAGGIVTPQRDFLAGPGQAEAGLGEQAMQPGPLRMSSTISGITLRGLNRPSLKPECAWLRSRRHNKEIDQPRRMVRKPLQRLPDQQIFNKIIARERIHPFRKGHE
jgi:hypothetical protein